MLLFPALSQLSSFSCELIESSVFSRTSVSCADQAGSCNAQSGFSVAVSVFWLAELNFLPTTYHRQNSYLTEKADSEIGLDLHLFPDPLNLNIPLISTSVSLALVTHSWLHLVAIFL